MIKHAFWQALVFTVFIFGIGLFFGFFVEQSRVTGAQLGLINSEVNVLDAQIRERALDTFAVDCELAVQSTFDFADTIYYEARTLEQYDNANKFPDLLGALHRRYDLLRTMLWIEAVELKDRCDVDFHTVVYLYEYNTEDIDTSSYQAYYSRLLYDLKLAHPEEVILIPIAANSGLASLDLLVEQQDVSTLPAIVIDERTVVTTIITFDELETIVFESNN